MRSSDIDALLKRQPRADGSYRVVASKASGTPLSGFPSRHPAGRSQRRRTARHRRELRGYNVFAAWLNQFDANSINSLDTLICRMGAASCATI
jgi:hypothetical protein